MVTVVQKYGGSSVADVDKLGRVADKVVAARREGNAVVVVVSAMGKTTDQLLALAKQVDPNPPRRELDMLLTTGERVSMALLAMAIQKRGLEAISFTGSQSGIITNDRHFDARILEVRPHRIEDELARGRIVIVAGYQGMSYRREITTLGRGGSDTTAIALAAALDADRAEIYSDVDGVYSADPRVVPDAKHLPHLDYEAMQEMAEVGAKVLNATAVEFAKKAKIAIHARSTFEPGRETVVREGTDHGARSVVGQRGVVLIETRGEPALSRASSILAESSVPTRDVEARPVEGKLEASMTVATSLTPDWDAVRARLATEIGEGMRLHAGLAAASVVGLDTGSVGEAVAIARGLGAEPRSVVASGSRLSMIVDEAQLDALVRALHDRFVR
ncbi:MAG: aspartate kinase [Deltaproteobacteria bacterium]|nr:aspartate kinase [Deltaproteobacteria bacterium]